MHRIQIIALPVLLLALVAAGPAHAYKWPGTAPAPGGAIAAKVIGQNCPGVLTAYEMGELDAYLDKAARELDARAEPGAPPFATFAAALTETYQAESRACATDVEEEARDMLQRVRRVMASSAPLYPAADDPHRTPDITEAMRAKLTGEKCSGAMAAVDLAELDLFMARAWVWWARNATDGDARRTMELYKASGRRMEAEWTDGQCSPTAIDEAKSILALVRKQTQASRGD